MIYIFKKAFKKIVGHPKVVTLKQNVSERFVPRRTVEGANDYSVVSAVYNVEKYLEDYFESLVGQTLDFQKHIRLILVDDGSTDNSAKIIEKCRKRYPDNIVYIKKSNGGQASARNLGLNYVQTKWVTFIDPDDFVSKTYFETVDRFLQRNENESIGLISCNFIFYYEDEELYRDNHPLNYRFRKKERIVSQRDMQKMIQLSVNSAFFKTQHIHSHAITFDERIKPNFEDAHFVNRYLLENDTFGIAFLKKAKYFYRKRSDGTSTLDTTWKKKEQYDDVLRYGCLDLLKRAQKIHQEKIPKYIQRTVLYHMIWYIKYLVNKQSALEFLTNEQIETFKRHVDEIFSYIEPETVENFELAGVSYLHKIGILGYYKKTSPSVYRCFIDKYDEAKSEIKLRIYHHIEDIVLSFYLDDLRITPIVRKTKRHDLLGDTFCYESIIWLPLSMKHTKLHIATDNCATLVSCRGKNYRNHIPIDDIVRLFDKKFSILFRVIPPYGYNDVWLFMDRDTQADDNAEHFYRYVRSRHPEINIRFVLRKESHDWERLEQDGFRLIPFGSLRHILALFKAKHLISSHADYYITDFVPRKYFKHILRYKFTFLQHGIIMNDLSSWLNTKKIDCFVTTAQKEYDSIVSDYTHYNLTEKEVVLTGLPRHDALLSKKTAREKIILIMPTWRASLVGKSTGKTNNRNFNPNFQKSEYFKQWYTLLHNKALKHIAEHYGYEIVFFPHANIQPYLHLFEVPSYVKTFSHEELSVQRLFQQSSVMITDYSSVAFEMALLERAVVYFQFDHTSFFTGDHAFQQGYFNFEKDGFGPVCTTRESLVDTLHDILRCDAIPSELYMERIHRFFRYHDTNNSKRVFQAVRSMEEPRV